ncbi:Hypothetical protein LUCI_4448 [Lucifera butyrica]|uniref:Flavodoxin n=1 Tax=Lucifera butyrica TaxID=1351585 RepID=A0A498RGG2_9FIRM|nr:flavodoxin [Lucifera butyrica]VBB09162.1 Hypothetical protein LUCI_4448 [Lucifera butyrica]
MKILNLFCSCTGNTKKIALQIEKTVQLLNHEVNTIEVTATTNENAFNFLDFDFVFIGSGVYSWLPPKFMCDFLGAMLKKHIKQGDVKGCAPRIAGKRAVTYCTYGGAHTGINEAVMTPKYLGQLLDHLGFEMVTEWLFECQYNSEGYTHWSVDGRLGDITGRPNDDALRRVGALVTGILKV